ncbi:hypothetical protein EJ04DRAFT_82987 [Polyplosphaeria fusca]|uniref:Uncharacterized protein n=1 Tax=Polyplosphaeria fusca TaxID=682080 RepID=A0A9P4QM26_9PLEO|nr:hypothetical protein EJ04DRAFT_82987 [Polyplosphaeria fusca]
MGQEGGLSTLGGARVDTLLQSEKALLSFVVGQAQPIPRPTVSDAHDGTAIPNPHPQPKHPISWPCSSSLASTCWTTTTWFRSPARAATNYIVEHGGPRFASQADAVVCPSPNRRLCLCRRGQSRKFSLPLTLLSSGCRRPEFQKQNEGPQTPSASVGTACQTAPRVACGAPKQVTLLSGTRREWDACGIGVGFKLPAPARHQSIAPSVFSLHHCISTRLLPCGIITRVYLLPWTIVNGETFCVCHSMGKAPRHRLAQSWRQLMLSAPD